jgi:Spy/CpxP family protein refolding chaperone
MNARIRALAVLVAVFLIGTSAGAIAYRFYAAKTQTVSAPALPKTERPPRSHMQELLNMSPEQKTKFEEIWKEFRPRFEALRTEQEKKIDALRAEVDPRYEELRAEVNRRIVSILTEEQKQKFEALQKDANSKKGRRRLDRPGPTPEKPGPPS